MLAVTSLLMAFASISTDLYLPAMPTMVRDLGVTPGVAAMTVSTYLIGFSAGQLIWGPLSDRFGRRAPILAGLLVFILGSAGCALAGSGTAIVCSRAIQAIGACASVVLARAMVRDRFAGVRGAQVMSSLMTVMAIAPLLGPSIGSLVLEVTGSWRAIFWLLVATGIATACAVWTLPETLPTARRCNAGLLTAFLQYKQLMLQPRLLAFAGALGFFYAGTFAYIAASPFIYIEYFRLAPSRYALIFSAGVAGLMVANLVNRRLVPRIGAVRLLRAGAIGAGVAGGVMLIAVTLRIGGLWGVFVPAIAFVAATGFIVANGVTAALEDLPTGTGAASALLGAIQYGGGVLGAAVVGALSDKAPFPVAAVVAVTGAGCVACAFAITLHGPSQREADVATAQS
ncbi:multidrug effflux MFS transporter [Rhodanobacter sp. A1T4]|uniref:multidrug effflux MFS transporter n=1 Tax=Rhodanobacter sp. A1T4 TaxID=2723087 RepID=UPI002104DC68|nr:multidrug effflux MFS transporter [Rhodanobacter sp. A1T4]